MKANRWAVVCALFMAVLSACEPDAAQGGLKTGTVEGKTLTAEGLALAGVLVQVEGTDVRATSDAQGAFRLQGLKPGAHSLAASRADYLPTTQPVEVTADATATVSLMLARREGRLVGTLRLDDGKSHEGITVAIEGTALSATTDASGAFVLEHVKPGSWRVVASKEDYVTRETPITVRADTTSTVSLTLTRAVGRIAGTVRFDDATSHGGITVALEGTSLSTTTDASGAFSFTSVKTGTWRLVASKADYVTQETPVTVRADTTSTMSLTLTRKIGRAHV